ncbi:MAG: hypothetical protein EXQ85_04590 [Alphaproteobacteria bacterium]|nr:hypothetical protein [Alphaproteobacteria bacterium]
MACSTSSRSTNCSAPTTFWRWVPRTTPRISNSAAAPPRPEAWDSASGGERLASGAILGTAALASVVGLPVLLSIAEGPRAIVSAAVFGAGLVLAHGAAALYHTLPSGRLKRVAAAIDHSTIYVLIAATYTPFALVVLWDHTGWLLLVAVWTLAALGIMTSLFLVRRLHPLSTALSLVLGWCGVPWAVPLYEILGPTGLALLLAGGVAYTGGVVFFAWSGLKWHNAI